MVEGLEAYFKSNMRHYGGEIMSEIDVSKYRNCPYWHYGHCQNNIINVLNSECSVHQNCFIKKTLEQLQQLKAENEELKKKLKTIYDILDMCENCNCTDCKYEDCDDCTSLNHNDIMKLIKQAKEGE